MSLLTNEQIEELSYIFIDNKYTSRVSIKDDLEKWNEKQTGVQVNVDWDKHAKESQHAELRLHFIVVENDSELWSDSKETILIERPKPIITPHPHAEMIMKYAEVAQRRADPWVELEYEDCGQWKSLSYHPLWWHNTEYRHIGDKK